MTRTGLEKVVTLDREKSAVRAAQEQALREGLFEPFLPQEHLQARYNALTTLEVYASTLNDLATLDTSKEIDETARNFKKRLDGISGLLVPAGGESEKKFKDQASSAIATLANAVVRAVINKKKDDAIRSVLPKADAHISGLCTLLAGEFKKRDEMRNIGGEFYDQVENSYRKLQLSIEERFEKSPTPEERLKLAREYGELVHDKEVTLAFFESIGKSLDRIAEAHAALARQATEGTSAQVALTALMTEIRALTSFYTELQKSGP